MRVCMPTWRNFSTNAFRGPLYEAQDVVASIDDVDLLHIEATPAFSWKEKWLRKLIWKDVTKQLIRMNPGLKPVRLHHDYDLFVVMCQQWWELLNVNAIVDWRKRSRRAICWLDEVYSAEIWRRPHWLSILNEFDHIVLPYQSSADALSEVLNRPCHYVPRAVDVIRFSPYPFVPQRVVDVLSIGRRWPDIHRTLLDMSQQGKLFYVHDTVADGGDQRMNHASEHRTMLSNLIKRSRYFMVSPGKMLDLQETKGQMEPGMRYFEGAAAGAILIGQPVDTPSFRSLFDWPNIVTPLNPDGSDVEDALQELNLQPGLQRRISNQNAAICAQRHDWLHRWETILRLAETPATARFEVRKAQLDAIANHFLHDLQSGHDSTAHPAQITST